MAQWYPTAIPRAPRVPARLSGPARAIAAPLSAPVPLALPRVARAAAPLLRRLLPGVGLGLLLIELQRLWQRQWAFPPGPWNPGGGFSLSGKCPTQAAVTGPVYCSTGVLADLASSCTGGQAVVSECALTSNTRSFFRARPHIFFGAQRLQIVERWVRPAGVTAAARPGRRPLALPEVFYPPTLVEPDVLRGLVPALAPVYRPLGEVTRPIPWGLVGPRDRVSRTFVGRVIIGRAEGYRVPGQVAAPASDLVPGLDYPVPGVSVVRPGVGAGARPGVGQPGVVVPPVGVPSDVVVTPPGVVTTPPSSHRWRPPPSYARERKVKMPTRGAALVLLSAFTEVADFVAALHDALPSKLRRARTFRGADGKLRRRRLDSMLRDLWEHWDQVDIGEAFANVAAEAAKDAVIGAAMRAVNARTGDLFRSSYLNQGVGTQISHAQGRLADGNAWGWLSDVQAAAWRGLGWEKDARDLARAAGRPAPARARRKGSLGGSAKGSRAGSRSRFKKRQVL